MQCQLTCYCSLQSRHNEHIDVSNHWYLDVCSTTCSGADQTKHQSSPPLAFVRGIHQLPVVSPHKGPVTRKKILFDQVIMFYLFKHTNFPKIPTGQWPNLLLNKDCMLYVFMSLLWWLLMQSPKNSKSKLSQKMGHPVQNYPKRWGILGQLYFILLCHQHFNQFMNI